MIAAPVKLFTLERNLLRSIDSRLKKLVDALTKPTDESLADTQGITPRRLVEGLLDAVD